MFGYLAPHETSMVTKRKRIWINNLCKFHGSKSKVFIGTNYLIEIQNIDKYLYK
jgi:hypothetical protein